MGARAVRVMQADRARGAVAAWIQPRSRGLTARKAALALAAAARAWVAAMRAWAAAVEAAALAAWVEKRMRRAEYGRA